MKPQSTTFRRPERRTEKTSKAEKVYNALQKDKKRAESQKKAAVAAA